MNNMLSPSEMKGTVHGAVYACIDYAMHDAVQWVAHRDATRDAMAVGRSVYWVVSEAVRVSPTHPNLDKFINEVEQNWSEV